MSVIGYLKFVREKLFKPTQTFSASTVTSYADTQAPGESLRSQPDIETRNAAAGETIEKFINAQCHAVEGLSVKFDPATRTMLVRGTAIDRATREKIILSCRKVIGIAHIEDRLSIATPLSLESNYRAARPGFAQSEIAVTEFRTNSLTKKTDMRAMATA